MRFRHQGITRAVVVAALGVAVVAGGVITIIFLKPSLWTEIQFMLMPELPPRVEQAVRRTEVQAEAEIDRHLDLLREVFEEAHRRVPNFVDRVLSLGAKWTYITQGETAFKQRVLAAFEEEVIGRQDIEQAVLQILGSYVTTLNNLDSQLLVELRADMPDPARAGIEGAFDPEKIVNQWVGTIPTTVTHALPKAIAGDVMSLVLGELAAVIGTRILVSTGVLSAGAASWPVTLGVGLVAGFIVDALVERLSGIRPYITEVCHQQLDKLYLEIAEGQDSDGTRRGRGLRQELHRYHQYRVKARRLMVYHYLRQQG